MLPSTPPAEPSSINAPLSSEKEPSPLTTCVPQINAPSTMNARETPTVMPLFWTRVAGASTSNDAEPGLATVPLMVYWALPVNSTITCSPETGALWLP